MSLETIRQLAAFVFCMTTISFIAATGRHLDSLPRPTPKLYRLPIIPLFFGILAGAFLLAIVDITLLIGGYAFQPYDLTVHGYIILFTMAVGLLDLWWPLGVIGKKLSKQAYVIHW